MGWVIKESIRRKTERLAPWADLHFLREELIEACIQRIENGRLSGGYRSCIEEFASGEIPTLPGSSDFLIIINGVILRHVTSQKIDPYFDLKYTEALGMLRRYFLDFGFNDWYRTDRLSVVFLE